MNAFEISEAVSKLAGEPFDPVNFPFAFLEAFGNKDTTIARLRNGSSNGSDVAGAVLQRSNIHLGVCASGDTAKMLETLKASPATKKQKAKFILATDGELIEAEDLASGEAIACDYSKIENHFGFFLSLAGITTVKQLHDNPIDIKATGRLNRLYIELLSENPDWGTDARRQDLNQFMARLIFCFFAEDTDIFHGDQLFTKTVEQMSDTRTGNTHEVIAEIFRAMDIPPKDRTGDEVKPWANVFPYVNGGLFTESKDVPRFSRIARSYFLHAGRLDWKLINPDIFGSMIQAVADDEERGELGMHYTSVPNILKVLNPLFLDDLREQLDAAGSNARSLLNLRKRMARIRVFDPACGSGNFLVIAYKEMRKLEAEINERRGEQGFATEIPLTNFRGIELRGFAAEIARLALIIAEYQCDVLYRGQKDALLEFLPLNKMNWITWGNALRLDWLSICPPTGDAVKFAADDLFHTPLEQAQIDFENQGGETYICGNPPYLGQAWQSSEQKSELTDVFEKYQNKSAAIDYVSAWLIKAAQYNQHSYAAYAFVTTNSMWQGQQVGTLWPILKKLGAQIVFAEASFKWKNLASQNAGVIVSIVGINHLAGKSKYLFETTETNEPIARKVPFINSYLVAGADIVVTSKSKPANGLSNMLYGNQPRDGGNLCLEEEELRWCLAQFPSSAHWFKKYVGSAEMIRGRRRGCIWIPDNEAEEARKHPFVGPRIENVRKMRLESAAPSTRAFANRAHRFVQIQGVAKSYTIAVAKVSSERRRYIPADILDKDTIISDLLFGIYDAPLWNFAIVASALHTVWVTTVCGKMKNDFRYSNTLGWNTFPVPVLSTKQKNDLTEGAHAILMAREAHFPASISDLYDPDSMPLNLRAAHDQNDEVIERIYIGRRFKSDTERLEKLFGFYGRSTKGDNAS